MWQSSIQRCGKTRGKIDVTMWQRASLPNQFGNVATLPRDKIAKFFVKSGSRMLNSTMWQRM
jgi:hypothetical protein